MIPFVRPILAGTEFENIQKVLNSNMMAGDGPFTKLCHKLLQEGHSTSGVLLTHSCTAALEMAALLSHIQPGDEVIMPSFTFVSTANAIVLRGGVPVFVDIRSDTKNMDETLIEAAITKKTKAILPVHYAGVACEMDYILDIAKKYKLKVIEDAAQAYKAFYKGKALGTLGDYGALSFHQTKNIISGEGGALFVRESEDFHRAEIIREKGTDRSRFLRGEIDKYCWRDIGSSFLPSELIAAFLYSQLERAEDITKARLALWHTYHEVFKVFEDKVGVPKIPDHCEHNGHIYYLVFPNSDQAEHFVQYLKVKGVQAAFHYVPLHSSPAGLKFARTNGSLAVTEKTSSSLVRLPLWAGLESSVQRVITVSQEFLKTQL